MSPEVQGFYDPDTFTITYVVFDESSKDAVIIDSVWDYDPASGKLHLGSFDKVVAFIREQNLKVHFIMETHAHADHLTAAQHLKSVFPDAKTAIGQDIRLVQEVFKGVFNIDNLRPDGSQFDLLLSDGQEIEAGALKVVALSTPGHTPACMSYLIGDAVFTGDAMFIEDYGTGRCDFPAGSAEDLFVSITEKLYSLPDDTRVFVGHDYQPNGREVRFETTIGAEKERNIQLPASRSKDDFIKFRTERDATLSAPRLLYPSVQVNIRAGDLPEPESNGTRYMKLPLREG